MELILNYLSMAELELGFDLMVGECFGESVFVRQLSVVAKTQQLGITHLCSQRR